MFTPCAVTENCTSSKFGYRFSAALPVSTLQETFVPVVEDHLKSSLERLTIWRPSWSLLGILLPDRLRPRVRWFRQSLSGNSVHYRDT